MTGRYPFVELKLLTSDSPPITKWSHRTELSLDSDEDALWYTHFRSPFSLLEAQQQHGDQLQLEVYFMEKMSPRLGSLEDSLIQEKSIRVASAVLSDCNSIFRKQMKWVQLIGVLQQEISASAEGTNRLGSGPLGMYTVTMRYNPNPESTPRSLPSQLQSQRSQKEDPPSSLSLEEQLPPAVSVTEEAGVGVGAEEGGGDQPTEYEYDSYYHEGGYYDHYTHAYLGNAYDHEAGQYYHDENIVYDPTSQQATHDQTEPQQDQDQTQQDQEQSEQDQEPVPTEDPQLQESLSAVTAAEEQESQPMDEAHGDPSTLVAADDDLLALPPLDLEQTELQAEAENQHSSLPTEASEPPVLSFPLTSPKNQQSSDSTPAPTPAPLLSQSSKRQSSSSARLQQQTEREEVGFFEVQQLSISKLKKVGGGSSPRSSSPPPPPSLPSLCRDLLHLRAH
jgi:hypothetical protein